MLAFLPAFVVKLREGLAHLPMAGAVQQEQTNKGEQQPQHIHAAMGLKRVSRYYRNQARTV
ncbi:hypothetical protein D3C85_1803500 [compost metagenome]